MCFRQGTPKFMAAALMESNNNIAHTFVHDLESFFWVLLWIILTRVGCSWDQRDRSSFLNETMSPKVYGNVASKVKSTFLTSDKLTGEDDFDIPGNPNLAELARSVKRLVSKSYRKRPSPNRSWIDGATLVITDEVAKQQKTFDEEIAKLKDHDEMIRQFDIAIQGEPCTGGYTPWPSNDPAKPRQVTAYNSVVLSSKTSSKQSPWPSNDPAKPRQVTAYNSVGLSSKSSSKRSRYMAGVNAVSDQLPSSKRQR
jgi:Fungal protein kinase